MRGAIAVATAAWAILLDRSAVIGKCPNLSHAFGVLLRSELLKLP